MTTILTQSLKSRISFTPYFSTCRFLVKSYSSDSKSKHAFKEVRSALQNYEELNVTPLKLTGCLFGKPFTAAHIKYDDYYILNDTDPLLGEELVPQVKFKTLYQKGFENLHRLIEGELVPIDEESIDFISSVGALQTFLTNREHHERSLKRKEQEVDILDDEKGFVAALLTNHLLSPLVTGNEYSISTDCKDKPTYCPCWSNCKQKINYGQTSIGNEKMWYGIPDVILLPNSVMIGPVTKKSRKKYKLREERKKLEICEEKRHDNIDSEQIASQMISQTITCSLYTSKLRYRKPELSIPDISLIPSLVLTPSSYCVYMYDNKYDVLLSSGPRSSQLWNGSGYQFNTSAILHIWMILNHIKCMPRLHPAHLDCLQNTSNFNNLCTASGLQLSEIAGNILFKSNFFEPDGNLRKNRKRFYLE